MGWFFNEPRTTLEAEKREAAVNAAIIRTSSDHGVGVAYWLFQRDLYVDQVLRINCTSSGNLTVYQ